MTPTEHPQCHQDGLREELERNVSDAVRILVESMGCESFSLPVSIENGERKYLAFGTVGSIVGLLSPASDDAAPQPGAQGMLDLQR